MKILKICLMSIFVLCLGCIEGSVVAVSAEAVVEPPLTPRELSDTAHRRKCKITICSIFASKKMDGPDVGCDVTKTLRKSKIEQKYLGGKFGWPWGNARCKAEIKVKREVLVKAMTQDGYTSTLSKHNISCKLFKQDGKSKYELNLSITPVVKWKGGKAESVKLNIADITGSALATGGVWTLAKANGYFGVLDGPLKGKLNEFISKDCAELKSELAD